MSDLPLEVIIAAPFTIYTAPVGTTFPTFDAAPSGSWTIVGTSGNLNYEEGPAVKISQAQTIQRWRGLGHPGTRKVWRTDEDLKVMVELADMTLEQYAHALNNNAVTPTAAGSGTAGFKTIGLSRGQQVSQVALLVRGNVSPYLDGGKMQYELPICFQTGSQEVTFGKAGPAVVALEWTAIVDPSASSPLEYFGRLRAQTAAAL